MAHRPARPIKLYRHPLSGHCHRVQLFLSLLGLPHEAVEIDLLRGQHKTPEFLALNPFGQLPVIDDDGTVLADSNAILGYLAARYGDGAWAPADPVHAAHVQRWLSVAAGELAFGPAAARVITLFGRNADPKPVIERAHALCRVIDATLQRDGHAFITGAAPTIADVALYSYLAHAPEGNVSLDAYASLRAWLERIEALPGFVPMTASPVGLRAA